MGRPKLYTEEEKKRRNRERCAKWRAKHPDYDAKRYQENRDKILEHSAEYHAEYYKTPMGRASCLVKAYRREDKKYKRGECTLTAQWVVDNIFTKPCHYCGATGWDIIGCDRIDNSLPHTPDNVVPCCKDCNIKRGAKSYEEFKKEMEGI